MSTTKNNPQESETKCSEKGCNIPAFAHNMCHSHYQLWLNRAMRKANREASK